MEQHRIDITGLHRYCVVCGREFGPAMEKHCTPNSIVVILREGIFRKRTRYFTCDGRELEENELSQLKQQETTRKEELESNPALRKQSVRKAVEQPEAITTDSLTNVNINETLKEAFQLGETVDSVARLKAIQLYANVIRTTPTTRVAWFNMGVIQSRMGRWQEAIRSFRLAQDDPDLLTVAAFAVLKVMYENGQQLNDDDLPFQFRGEKLGALGVQGPCHNAANELRNRGYECKIETKGESCCIHCDIGRNQYIIQVNDMFGSLVKNVLRKHGDKVVNLGDIGSLSENERKIMALNIANWPLVQAPVSGVDSPNGDGASPTSSASKTAAGSESEMPAQTSATATAMAKLPQELEPESTDSVQTNLSLEEIPQFLNILGRDFSLTMEGINWKYEGRGSTDFASYLNNADNAIILLEQLIVKLGCSHMCIVTGNPQYIVFNVKPPTCLTASLSTKDIADLLFKLLLKFTPSDGNMFPNYEGAYLVYLGAG